MRCKIFYNSIPELYVFVDLRIITKLAFYFYKGPLLKMTQNLQLFFTSAKLGNIRQITPLTMGLSGAGVYAVTTEVGEFILRQNVTPRNSDTFAQALSAQRLAAEQNLAPKVIYADRTASVTISEKITGVHMGMILAQPEVRPRALHGLATTLGRLHDIPAPALPGFDTAVVQSIWDEQAQRRGFPDWATPLERFVAAGNAAMREDDRRVFSHNDTNPANILWDGSKIFLIDWERAALSHPYLDLAIFANFANLSDDDAVSLLAVQERSTITQDHREIFITLRHYASAILGAVFMRLIPDLATIDFASREATPSLLECYRRMAAGTLDLKTPTGQGLIGAALWKQIPDYELHQQ